MLLARVRNDAVLTLIKQSGKHTKLLPANDASAEGLATDSAGITRRYGWTLFNLMRTAGLQAAPHIHDGWPVPGSPLLVASSDATACGTKTLY